MMRLINNGGLKTSATRYDEDLRNRYFRSKLQNAKFKIRRTGGLMKKGILIIGGIFLASCTMQALKQHAGPTPPDEGCGHCHYLIYKDWKISYKPYEQVPVPGSTIAPGPFPQYHERKAKEAEVGTTVMPTRKDCSACHVGVESPEGKCTREGAGFK
jgi:hypothetical protein